MCDNGESPGATIVAGIALAVASSIIGNVGVNMQKRSFMREAEKPLEYRRPYAKQPRWWIGMSFVITAALVSFASFALAPQSVVAPMGALVLVWNLGFAHKWLGERLTKRDLLGTFLVILGVVFIVAFGSRSNKCWTVDAIKQRYTTPEVWAYIAGVVAVAFIYYALQFRASNMLIYLAREEMNSDKQQNHHNQDVNNSQSSKIKNDKLERAKQTLILSSSSPAIQKNFVNKSRQNAISLPARAPMLRMALAEASLCSEREQVKERTGTIVTQDAQIQNTELSRSANVTTSDENHDTHSYQDEQIITSNSVKRSAYSNVSARRARSEGEVLPRFPVSTFNSSGPNNTNATSPRNKRVHKLRGKIQTGNHIHGLPNFESSNNLGHSHMHSCYDKIRRMLQKCGINAPSFSRTVYDVQSYTGAIRRESPEEDEDDIHLTDPIVSNMIASPPIKYKKFSRIHPLALAGLTGVIGAQNTLFSKTVGEMLNLTFRGDVQLYQFLFYVFLAGLVGSILIQQHFMARSLQIFDALYVVPVFQAHFILTSIISGGINFQEFSSFQVENFILFPFGVLILISGIIFLSGRKMQQHVHMGGLVGSEVLFGSDLVPCSDYQGGVRLVRLPQLTPVHWDTDSTEAVRDIHSPSYMDGTKPYNLQNIAPEPTHIVRMDETIRVLPKHTDQNEYPEQQLHTVGTTSIRPQQRRNRRANINITERLLSCGELSRRPRQLPNTNSEKSTSHLERHPNHATIDVYGSPSSLEDAAVENTDPDRTQHPARSHLNGRETNKDRILERVSSGLSFLSTTNLATAAFHAGSLQRFSHSSVQTSTSR